METSLQAVFLVILAAASTGYAFYSDVRRGARNDRFLDWVRTERSGEWGALSRADRLLSIRAIEILRRGSLADDADFQTRYQATRPDARFAAAMIVSGASIALLILGSVFLEWNW